MTGASNPRVVRGSAVFEREASPRLSRAVDLKRGPWTCSISIIRELTRNANSGTPPDLVNPKLGGGARQHALWVIL